MLGTAIRDLTRGMLHHRVWMQLGWVEVKQRYRRSVLGPWWITLSMLIFILMMGIVFSRLFHQSLGEYIPFFTAGFLFWTFISTSVVEAADVFNANAGFIKQIKLPYSLYIFKHLTKQAICLLHNSVVYLLACLVFKINPGWNILLLIPGFILFVVNMYWICFFIAMICARFRDMIPIINSCVQVAFFVTPISWMPKLLDQNSAVLKLNPLVYLIDIVRAPLLGRSPAAVSWTVCLSMAMIGCFISFSIFSRVRSQIAFWVD